MTDDKIKLLADRLRAHNAVTPADYRNPHVQPICEVIRELLHERRQLSAALDGTMTGPEAA